MQLVNNFLSTKRQKTSVFALLGSVLFGTIFILTSYYFINAGRIDSNWVKVQGKVVEINVIDSSDGITYAPIVAYQVDGVMFRVQESMSSSNVPVIGSERTVGYNPSAPIQAKVEGGTSYTLFVGIFGLVGVVIITASVFSYIRSLRRTKLIDSLVTTGQKVQGVVTEVSSKGNEKGIFRVVVTAPNLAGQVTNYVSDPISGIGGLALIDYATNPIAVDVYIDSLDTEKYYVDISDLPNLTADNITDIISKISKQNTAPTNPNQTIQM